MSERAMMSDRERRGEAIMYGATPQSFLYEAECASVTEAASILAATEPDCGAAWRITGQGWACDPETRVAIYSVRVALAESLAAFVGADDPGAYLAGVAR